MTAKAYSYLRFSTPEQMKGDSHRRQTALAQEWVARNGVALDDRLTFHDLGVSAFRGKNAETGRLGEFLEAVRTGLVERGSILLVESLDRISRQAARKALRVLEDICAEDITVVTLADGRTYTNESLDSDPTTLLMSLLIFIRANEESTNKGRRIRAAWTGKRLQAGNKPLTAKCPGWLSLDRGSRTWVVNPERAAVVKRVFQEVLEGRGQHAITEGLNRDRIPVFGKAGHWHRSYVVKLLNNPAVMGTFTPCTLEWENGKRVRKPQEPLPGYFPAVVDAETFQRVQAMKQAGSSSARGANAGKELQNVLGGLLLCPRCGDSMCMVNKGPRTRRYVVCSRARTGAGCTYEAVRYDRLEGALLHGAEPLLCDPPAGGTDGSELQAEIVSLSTGLDELEDYLRHLAETYRTNRLHTILNQMQEAERERDEASQKLRELAAKRDASLGPFVERRTQECLEALRAEPMDRKRTNILLRSIFTSVTVNPENGTMDFLWKGGGESSVVYTMPRES